jgi:hypothetical protein
LHMTKWMHTYGVAADPPSPNRYAECIAVHARALGVGRRGGIAAPTRVGIVSTRVFESSIDSLTRISEKKASTVRNGVGGIACGGVVALQYLVFIKYFY